MKKKVPELSVRRLINYYRYISDLFRQKQSRILSEDIARYFSIDPSQVRKDFSFFGPLGKRGCGYAVPQLMADMEEALVLTKPVKSVLVGCGKLGSALLGYPVLQEFHFHILRGFDTDPAIIGRRIHDIPVVSWSAARAFIRKNGVRVAILAVPKENAQEVAGQLVEYGIRGILNFAPVFLRFGKRVHIKNVDFSVDFNIFRYQIFKGVPSK